MGVTGPRNIFGIHSILFYRRSDRKPYGPPLKVLASGGIDMPADFEDLTGGSERFIIASEVKSITPEMKLTTKEFPDYLFQLFMGATVTKNAAEAGGNVSALTNANGTTLQGADGIASVAVDAGSEANLKFGKYVVVANSATTVNILTYTDIDFRRGVDVSYQNDELEILATDVTITASGTTTVADLGIEFTGGAGPIAMTIGDTATFEVRPINSGSSIIEIGDVGTEFVEFGALVMASRRADGSLFEIDCYRCVGGGLPLNLEEKAWSQAELTIKVLKDFALDRVMRIRALTV